MDPISQFVLGKLYENGQGVEKNVDWAVKWYLKAAEQGLVLAQYRLAAILHEGEGVEKDPARSSNGSV